MSNPYWWIWWASIGSAFWVNFNISSGNIPGIVSFFLGHEAGDLAWYVFISFIIFFCKGFINKKIYLFVLILCGIFMILFGLYLGIFPFFKGTS
jgi:threonine/homoserine/homoserine lactone efflux protein